MDGPMKSNAFFLMVDPLQKIKTKSGKSPNDIAVTNDGDILYADWPLKRAIK